MNKNWELKTPFLNKIYSTFLYFTGGSHVPAKRKLNGTPRHSINGVSQRFKKMSCLYRHFAVCKDLDFSDEALISLYNYESYGTNLSPRNGFAHGKQMLNLQVTSWKEMLLEGTLAKFELYEDPNYPHWWLDSILKNLYAGETYESMLRHGRNGSAK